MNNTENTTPTAAHLAAKSTLAAAGIETLRPRNMDSLDFHELSVNDITSIIEEAYAAGLEAARKANK